MMTQVSVFTLQSALRHWRSRSSFALADRPSSPMSHASSSSVTASRSSIFGARATRFLRIAGIVTVILPSPRARHSSIILAVAECLLPVSFQLTSSFRISFGEAEDVNADRNAHDAGDNQGPGVAPYLRRPDDLVT